MPAEMLPARIDYHDVRFDLAAAKTGVPTAVVVRGQQSNFPRDTTTASTFSLQLPVAFRIIWRSVSEIFGVVSDLL